MPDRLTLADAAAAFGVSQQSLKKAAQRGRLRAVRVIERGCHVWYTTAEDVQHYLASRPVWFGGQPKGEDQ